MRGVFPVFIVILALSTREYVDRNVPGGLAYADREAVVDLAQETAIVVLEWANPNWRGHRNSWSEHRHQHSQQQNHVEHGEIFQTKLQIGEEQVSFYRVEQPYRRRAVDSQPRRLRGFGQRDRSPETDQPVEITFVVPVEKTAASATRRRGRGERRRH